MGKKTVIRGQTKITRWATAASRLAPNSEETPKDPTHDSQTSPLAAPTHTPELRESPTPLVGPMEDKLLPAEIPPSPLSQGYTGWWPNTSLWKVAAPPPCKTVDYKVAPWLIPKALESLGCTGLALDAFASNHNAVCPIFWTKATDAFVQPWKRWAPIWANPPFDNMEKVHRKILVEGAHLVLICPGWRGTLPAFKALAIKSYTFPPGPTFLHEGRHLMPAPKWEVHALYINYPGMGHSNIAHLLRSPLSGGAPAPGHKGKHPRHTAILAVLTGEWLEADMEPPKTGRGECPLSTNIETNPGPPWDNMPGRATNCLAYFVYAFIQRWNLADFITHEDFFPPEPGPSGEAPVTFFNMWQECTCICQSTLVLSPQQGIRVLIRHVTTCATLHAATGRGAELATCGDVELNPGPSGPSGPHQHDILGTIVPVICEDWDLGNWEFRGTNVPITEGPSSSNTGALPKDHEFSGVWGRCPECNLWMWLRGPHTALRHFHTRHPEIQLPFAPDPQPESRWTTIEKSSNSWDTASRIPKPPKQGGDSPYRAREWK